MKLRKHLGAILLIACLNQVLALGATATDTQPASPNASNNTANKDDLSAQKELFQVQLEAKKELLQKDIEAQAKRIDAFEKRIDDQNSRIGDIDSGVDMFGIIAGISGTLITVLLVGIGLWGYKTAKNDARETAKAAASQWFETNHHELISQMKELENRIVQAIQKIDEHEEDVAQRSNEFKEKTNDLFEKQMEASQTRLLQSTTDIKSEKQSPIDNSAIEQKAKQLKQKPESAYTFTDWNTRAFAAYSEGKLEDAIFYWDKAISSPDILPRTHAQAMLNQGYCLGQLNRNEEAIATYDALITQFGSATELAFREQVADAMTNKGFLLLCMAKNNWGNPALANELLTKASDACMLAISKNSNNGLAHGNLAYISCLQGDAVAAEQHFKTGFASTKNGGEPLYKGTLTDFDIHPIEPDQGFRALVEKLWGEYQAERART